MRGRETGLILPLEGIHARQSVERAWYFSTSGNAKLVLQRVDVRPRGSWRDAEPQPDFFIGQTCGCR